MKATFVDVDGVVFRSKKALRVVEQSIVRWVKKKADVPTLLHANEINKRAYSSYGHTFSGMKAMYPEADITLDDFNREVYSGETLAEAFDAAISDPSTMSHRSDFANFLEGCSSSKIPVYLLSNAPRAWVDVALTSFAMSEIKASSIFCSDDFAFRSPEWGVDDASILKPSIRSFAASANRAVNFGGFGEQIPRFHLVDDSKSNCYSAREYMGWKAFLFDGDSHYLSTDVLRWLESDDIYT